MATPVLLGAALMQAGLGRMGVDVVTPLVQRLYACDRLTGSAAPAGRSPAPRPDVEAPFARVRGRVGRDARFAARRAAGAPLRRGARIRGYAFTIVGVAIGVAGLVALGAMSERIVRFIDGGDRFVLGQISVAGRGMGMGTGFTAGGCCLRPASGPSARCRGWRRCRPR